MIRRTVTCVVCGGTHTEEEEGGGFLGWGQLSGVVLDGDVNPYLCPKHLEVVADFTDKLKHDGGVD